MSNIIDSIKLSGTVYTLSAQTSGGTVSSAITSGDTNAVAGGAVYDKFNEVEQTLSGKADSSDVETLSGTVTAHTANTQIHVTTAQTAAWDAKSDFSGSYNDLTDKPTIPTVPTNVSDFTNDAGYITSDALSGYAESSAVTEEINAAVSGKVNTSSVVTAVTSGSTDAEIPTAKAVYDAIPTGSSITIDPTLDSGSTNPVANSAITNAFNNVVNVKQNSDNGHVRWYDVKDYKNTFKYIIHNFSINGRMPLSRQNATDSNVDNFSLVEKSAITSAITSSSTDAQVPSAKCVYDQLGGLKLLKITQADYDALSGNTDSNTLYVIINS